MSVWDQSRDLVISNFIPGIQRIQNDNKNQLHWHVWYCNCSPTPHIHTHTNPPPPARPLCRSGVITSMAVFRSDGACQYWKGRNLWKAVTSKHWSMALKGLKQGGEIDPMGDIVTGDLQTRWKCQQGTRAQVQTRQFHRICVSQARWSDSDGRPRWPGRVMRGCQRETGSKLSLQGEYYIMVNSRLPGWRQSNRLSGLGPFY